ncbi:uncharacterized protein PG998_006045 [Apiospora kogelbergensis]|uniref:uncharacterized protein n=1 Tax=Apiospora kogelbergensis TaxID=1337665 RepID=UPI0031305FC3
MSQSIGGIVRDCLESFDSVLSDRAEVESKMGESLFLSKIKDEQDKFKVWSGNIGAHRKGMSSLDYRLRDASNLRKEVESLLEDLLEALTDARRILDGEMQPWDEDGSEGVTSSSRDEQQDDADYVEFGFKSELEQLLADVSEIVKYLYKVSAGLRNTSQHDRLMSSRSIDTSHYETFDIEHVRNKHPKVEDEISERLGRAITTRRHYFKYRESHRGKLGSGLVAGNKVTDGKSTIASSLPEFLKEAETMLGPLNIDQSSDSGFTQTSFATTVADSTTLRVPPLPKEATTQEYFECPLCFMIVSARTRRAWKRHVFADLRPYVCLYQGCPTPTQTFARRHHWVEHLRQQHWRVWKCHCDGLDMFSSQESFMAHAQNHHRSTIGPDQMETFIETCERPNPDFDSQTCKLCDELISSSQQYQRHIGRHLEQLALFALPTNYDTEDAGETEMGEDINPDSEKESTSSDTDNRLYRLPDQQDLETKPGNYIPSSTSLDGDEEEVLKSRMDREEKARVEERAMALKRAKEEIEEARREIKADMERKNAAEQAEWRKRVKDEVALQFSNELRKKAADEAEWRKNLEDEAKLKAEIEFREKLEKEKKYAEDGAAAAAGTVKADDEYKRRLLEEAKAKAE